MSELKEVKFHEMNLIKLGLRNDKLYFKSEADKVIAEKDAEIAELKDKALQYKVLNEEHCRDLNTQERFFAEQITHSNRKRCLAMAKWCENALLGWMGYKESFSSHQRYIKVMLFTKWQKRWEELAKEPTWAKFLQLIHKEAK